MRLRAGWLARLARANTKLRLPLGLLLLEKLPITVDGVRLRMIQSIDEHLF
jgi:hypothetical protein